MSVLFFGLAPRAEAESGRYPHRPCRREQVIPVSLILPRLGGESRAGRSTGQGAAKVD